MKAKPYTSTELMRMAGQVGGPQPLDPARVLATYADPGNWLQVNANDERGPRNYWAWNGPTITGYELAGVGLRDSEGRNDAEAELRNRLKQPGAGCGIGGGDGEPQGNHRYPAPEPEPSGQ